VLDETGKLLTTKALAKKIDTYKEYGNDISFVIGGPDGHSDGIRQRADFSWALSPLTFPHDIATLLCTEAIYRALTLSAGHPYHRA
jgi:23S rRNA (pseudouridine1915-N3)-methyltransferase